jgi:hypothetical protein
MLFFSFKLSKSAMKTYKASFVSCIFFAVLLKRKYVFGYPDLRIRTRNPELGSGLQLNTDPPDLDPDPDPSYHDIFVFLFWILIRNRVVP